MCGSGMCGDCQGMLAEMLEEEVARLRARVEELERERDAIVANLRTLPERMRLELDGYLGKTPQHGRDRCAEWLAARIEDDDTIAGWGDDEAR